MPKIEIASLVPPGRAPRTYTGVKGHTYTLIDTIPELETLEAKLMHQRYIAADTETTGIDIILHRVVGYSVSFGPHDNYYIPVRHETDEKQLPPRS